MLTINFNQLQLRLLIFFIFLFTGAVFSYRYFVERPQLEENMTMFSQRELTAVKFSVQNKLDALYRFNFDYAVWSSSYEYIKKPYPEYEDDNFVENTFVSLQIDGIFYFDDKLNLVYQQGLHHTKLIPLTYAFYDFQKYPENRSIFPAPTTKNGAPFQSGFIKTIFGPAMFSVTQIRDSNMDGDFRGYLMMLQLIEDKFVNDLSSSSLTKVSYTPNFSAAGKIYQGGWTELPQLKQIQPYSDMVLYDSSGNAVSSLRIAYSIQQPPAFFNQSNVLFVVLLGLFIYIVFLILSLIVIEPVSKLASEIKTVGHDRDKSRIDTDYLIEELNGVAQNVNALMERVQQQNKILAEQANTDQLTSIFNRRGLILEIEQHQQSCIRNQVGFIVVMVDLDHFKAYNDSVGHLEGDNALKSVAQLLSKVCQRQGDVCGRYGGEEFVLVFSEMTEQSLHLKLQSIVQAMQALNIEHPDSPSASYVTLSMGAVMVSPFDVVDFELPMRDIFNCADKALYAAKAAGRNTFIITRLSDRDTAKKDIKELS